MAYITENFLRTKAVDTVLEKSASVILEITKSLSSAKKIFLSHSHLDKELAKGLKNYLYSLGVDLYIDWEDSSMPPTTDKVTAEKIKNKIGRSDHVLVLATKNAMRSQWVPWEIGIADIKISPSSISIIPIVDALGIFTGNEYLQLYDRVEIAANNIIAVFKPKADRGLNIVSWLESI